MATGFDMVLDKITKLIVVRRASMFDMKGLSSLATVQPSIPAEITLIDQTNVDRGGDLREASFVRKFHNFLDEGHVGVYAWVGGKVVGHAWAMLAGNTAFREQGYLDVGANQAYIHYCNVKEDLRGKRLYPAMLCVLCHRLFSVCRVSSVVTYTAVDNIASRRGILKVGFEYRGDLVAVLCRGHLVLRWFRPAQRVEGQPHAGQ